MLKQTEPWQVIIQKNIESGKNLCTLEIKGISKLLDGYSVSYAFEVLGGCSIKNNEWQRD